jgi:F-type H+-transporting ATPase subunit delta
MRSTVPMSAIVEAYVDCLPTGIDPVQQVDEVVSLFARIPKLRSFLSDRSINPLERKKTLHAANEELTEETQNFIILLSRERMLRRMDRVSELVRQTSAAREGKRYAIVTTVIPLNAEERERAQRAIEKLIHHPVRMENKTDASILAGLTVSIGDWVYDASLKGRLSRLQSALL